MSFGAGVGDSVPPHLTGCEGVEHLVFEEEPQPLPLPLALLPALQAAAHGGALHGKCHLHICRVSCWIQRLVLLYLQNVTQHL